MEIGKKRPSSKKPTKVVAFPNGPADLQFISDTVVPGVVRHLVRTGKSAAELERPALPGMPPKTPQEIAQDAEICRRLDELAHYYRRRNLQNAVVLAQQAARGVGPLVEHFNELGRRYDHLVSAPPKPGLKVIKGGAA